MRTNGQHLPRSGLVVARVRTAPQEQRRGREQFDALDAHVTLLGPSHRQCPRTDPEVTLTIQECLSMATYYRRVRYNPRDAPILLTQVNTTCSYGVAPTTSLGTSVEVVARQCFYRLEQPHTRAMTAYDIQHIGYVAYSDKPGIRAAVAHEGSAGPVGQ